MGLLGLIVGAVSSAISSVVHIVGNAIGSIAQSLVAKIPETEGLFVKVIKAICEFVKDIAVAFGLIEEEDEPEHLGAKATQEDTRHHDEFKSEQEYIDYLRNEVKLDEERLGKMNVNERNMARAVGIGILDKGIEEKTGVQIPSEFLIESQRIGMKSNEVKSLIDAFMSRGLSSMSAFVDFAGSKELGGKGSDILSALREGVSAADPKLPPNAVDSRITEILGKVGDTSINL